MAGHGLKAALISRLTCALGYSAYDLIRDASPPSLLTGLVPLFACGAVYCKRIEGLQIMFAILAAQGLPSLPHEPPALGAVTNVLLYFAVFSIVRSQLLITDAVSDQFMALSLNARALSYFKSADQVTEAAVMSVAYLVVRRASARGVAGVVDCFATRSAALWIASFFEPDALLLFLMVCPYESDITSIMGLKCAQQLVGRTSEAEAMLVMTVILLFFNGRLAACGISILAVKRLEESIKEWNHAETAAVYMSAFCLLQLCKGGDDEAKDEGRGIIIIAHEEADLLRL